jgi:alpha-L-fucosidase
MAQEKQYEANWESLKERPYPQWFKDAKLGIFIHWGVYSVPAYSNKEDYAEWYVRGLMLNDSLRTSYMKTHFGEDFTYKDFAPLFKTELFYPDEWAEIFKNAGAKYVVMVSKHHDGYAMWPSKYSPNWNSMDVGPKRDLVGELTNAVKAAGLHMGLYYSLPEWTNPLHLWDTDPHRNIGPYVEKHMIPQFKELMSAYKPDLIFSDGEWFNTAEEWHSAELISWYYNMMGPDAIVNNRWGAGSQEIGFLTPEYSSGITETDRPWAEVRGLGRSFGLNRFEKLEAYMTGEELIHFFVNKVANGGGMIINVGPKSDGQIPLLQQDRLNTLGEWLKENGEAIYGSTAWEVNSEEKEISEQRIDPTINFNWVRNGPMKPIKEDHFTATWDGFITPEHSGEFVFEAAADDGFRMWVDGELVINQWEGAPESADGIAMENTATQTTKGKINLEAGKRYKVRAEYFENQQNARAELYWSTNGMAKEIVPSANWYTSSDGSEHGLKAEYNSMKQHMAYTTNHGDVYAISYDWPDDELRLTVDAPNPNAKVTLLGTDKALAWEYQEGQMIIDTGSLKFSEMKMKHAWVFKIEEYLYEH